MCGGVYGLVFNSLTSIRMLRMMVLIETKHLIDLKQLYSLLESV